MDNKVILFQVRIMFKFKDKDIINFKIITDTRAGIDEFVERLKSVENIERISVEYLCEYDCLRIGEIINVYSGGDNDEKSEGIE